MRERERERECERERERKKGRKREGRMNMRQRKSIQTMRNTCKSKSINGAHVLYSVILEMRMSDRSSKHFATGTNEGCKLFAGDNVVWTMLIYSSDWPTRSPRMTNYRATSSRGGMRTNAVQLSHISQT